MKKMDFNPTHLALPLDEFKGLFSHLPERVVLEAWNEANPQPKKEKIKKSGK